MLSLAPVVMLMTGTAATVAGHGHHIPDMALGVLIVLVGANFVLAQILISPVQHFLAYEQNRDAIIRRVRRLPLYSGISAFATVTMLMLGSYYLHHISPGLHEIELPLHLALHYIALVILSSAFLALTTFFLVATYTARLRRHLIEQLQLQFPAQGGRIGIRLAVAFSATALVPAMILLAHAGPMEELRAVHGVALEQALRIDFMAAALLILLATFFVQRALTTPIHNLIEATKRIEAGELCAQAPVLADDEVGRLAESFNRMSVALQEREFVRAALGRFIPEPVAQRVLEDRGALAPLQREATVLFTDIAGFSGIAEQLQPDAVMDMLNEYFTAVAEPIHAHGGMITQFQGDAVLAVFNMPLTDEDHAANGLRAALEIQETLQARRFAGGRELATRIGLNTGAVVGGTVGDGKMVGYTVHGDAVNVAARLEALNKDLGTHLLVADRTRMLCGSEFAFEPVGATPLRGRSTTVQPFTAYWSHTTHSRVVNYDTTPVGVA
jgi:class 3 adenylate cyclase